MAICSHNKLSGTMVGDKHVTSLFFRVVSPVNLTWIRKIEDIRNLDMLEC